ncbi:arabinose efflux permease family protein [Opitutaceae bacterium TAV1]|nr:arabinose efflux permease family protein [Opitutaceae bacterium TAV1]
MSQSRIQTVASPHRSSLQSWLAVLSVALGAFVVVTSEFLPIGLLTDIAAGLHVSDGTAGLMVTIPGLVAALAAPVMAVAAGKVDRRTLVLSLITLLVVSNLVATLAPGFAVMLVARVLFGITLGGFWTVAVALGSQLVPPASMARATTIILAGISIATVIGVPAGALIANFAGWRFAFALVGSIALVVGVAQFFLLPSIRPKQVLGVRQITHLLRNADARNGLFTVAFVIAGHFAAYTYIAPFLKQQTGVNPGMLSTLLLAYGVAGIVGNFAGGAAAARDLRRTLVTVILLMATAILLLPVVGLSPAGASVLVIAWGLTFGAMPVALQLWVFKSAPDALEGGAAMMVSVFQIFIAIGSVAGGIVVDHFGTPAVMWGAGAVSLTALAMVRLSRHAPVITSGERQPHLV